MSRRIVDVDEDLQLLRDSVARCHERIDTLELSDQEASEVIGETLEDLRARLVVLEDSLAAAEREPAWVRRYAKAVTAAVPLILGGLSTVFVDGTAQTVLAAASAVVTPLLVALVPNAPSTSVPS